jgi:hypothetical protein
VKTYIEVRGNVGFADGDWAIGFTNIATRQTTVPPLAFPTREAAEAVVASIVAANPTLYTREYPWRDET